MQVPLYAEISVKNLYEDAMNDPLVSQYLPSLEQSSNKLPEREFFFGIICTLREDYMREIIQTANELRFRPQQEENQKKQIKISEDWLDELTKHPYFSSKIILLTSTGKSGTAIFLMKEGSKKRVSKGSTKTILPIKRLHTQITGSLEDKLTEVSAQKRKQPNLSTKQRADIAMAEQ